MKTIIKPVYYCDFCNKRMLAGGAMKAHEKKCTANPKRQCGLCGGGNIVDVVAELKGRFELKENNFDFDELMKLGGDADSHTVIWKNKPVTLEEIIEHADNCPNCILAILRQTGMNKHYFKFKYDYKAEFDKAVQEKRHEEEYNRNY